MLLFFDFLNRLRRKNRIRNTSFALLGRLDPIKALHEVVCRNVRLERRLNFACKQLLVIDSREKLVTEDFFPVVLRAQPSALILVKKPLDQIPHVVSQVDLHAFQAELGRELVLSSNYILLDLEPSIGEERRLADQHLVDHDAEAEPVDGQRLRLPQINLRSDVLWRTADCLGNSARRKLLRQAEVD